MSGKIEWGIRRKADTSDVQTGFDSLSDVLRFSSHLEPEDGEHEIVIRAVSGWVAHKTAPPLLATLIPPTECVNCQGTNLGFGLDDGGLTAQFYLGCNECSETLWIGDWDLFLKILAYIYDMRVPTLD